MSSDPDAAPINPLPVGVILLALPIVLVELWISAGAQGFIGGPGAVGWRLEAIERFGFSSLLFDYMLASGSWPPEHLVRFLTYPFVHAGFLHMLMVLVFLLALGKLVAEVLGSWAAIAVFFGSAVIGALVYGAVTSTQYPLTGGYPAVYGLIGAYTFLLRIRIAAEGGPQHQAFYLIGMLLLIQLVFGLLYGTGPDWIAEIAGFAAGFCLTVVLAPGGWARALSRIRRR